MKPQIIDANQNLFNSSSKELSNLFILRFKK
jgi:hypothetical protein